MVAVPEILRQHEITDSKKQLRLLLKEQRRRKGLRDLHFLAKEILQNQDLTDKEGFHGEYCEHLEDDKYNFKLTLTPRGTLKTTIGTVAKPLQDMIKNPNVRILLASEKYSNSTKILTEIKGHIENNEDFKELYGNLKGDKWTESEIIIRTRNSWKKEPTITCAGIDVTKVGMHYDIIYVDDPHSDQNTTNQEQIDKVIRWYKLLLSLLDPGGYLFITGTIWHYNDLYSYIINKERERLEAGRKPRFKIFIRDSFTGTTEQLMNDELDESLFLWPERLSPEFLKDQYLEQGPYIFSCQYRLNPIDDETAVFKRSWMKGVDPSQLPDNVRYYSTVDPMRDEEGKDYLAIITSAIDSNWQEYVVDTRRLKADEHDTVEELFSVYKKFKPVKIGIETVAWQKTFYRYVKMLQMMKGYRLPIVELKTDTKITKKMRIKSLVPYLKTGLIKFIVKDGDINNATGNMATLIDELTRYPKVANDDCPDALSYMNQLTNRPGVVQIIKKLHPRSFMAERDRLKKPTKRLGSLNVIGRMNG
jgi:predicted phage terminase large subunit-like protein